MKSKSTFSLGVFLWWIALASVGTVVTIVLFNFGFSRVVYVVIVAPIGGVLVFPIAYAANRWLTPVLVTWIRRQ